MIVAILLDIMMLTIPYNTTLWKSLFNALEAISKDVFGRF